MPYSGRTYVSPAPDEGWLEDPNAGKVAHAGAGTVTGPWVDVLDAQELVLWLDSNAGTGTTPTLDVKLQTSPTGADADATDVPGGAFTQVSGVASKQVKRVTDFLRFVRPSWTLGGTTPAFTFGVWMLGRRPT